jgi:2-hydroxychromene-2-carboxylate isomerase
VLRHVWVGGADAEAPDRFAAMQAELAPRLEPAGDEAKQRLRTATDAAIAAGLFGVPTIGVGDKRFWGFDALEMVSDLLRGAAWFDAPHWDREGAPRPGVVRR